MKIAEEQQEWLSVSEVARLKNITDRAVRKAISQGKYISRFDGKKYEILLSSLEEKVKNLIKFDKSKNKNEKSLILKQEKVVPEKAVNKALARYDLVKIWEEFKNSSASKTQAGKDFITAYNSHRIYPALYKTLGKVSIGTIYRWQKELQGQNSYKKLIPQYTYGERATRKKLTAQEKMVFLNFLLSPNKTNIGKAIKLTQFILNRRGVFEFSSKNTYRRFANEYKKENYDKWILARDGQKALRDNVEPYIVRDASKLEVGDVIVADGHRLAFQIISPFSGTPTRATIVGYQDWKSTALLGFEIMLEENTQCIASALRNSILNLGKIPKISYQDNGKAFRSKYFTDEIDFRECGINGLFAGLGIIPVFANPYNARAKTIERFFKEFQDSFERLLPSFVGSSIKDKPAYMLRNEKFHKEHHNSFIPTLEQTVQLINNWIEFHYAQPCPNVKGKTIGEVLSEGRGEGVDIKELDDLMMAKEVKTIHRNGIRFLKADYYNENLYGLRDRVLIKYSLFDLSKIRVYRLTGEFLCEAERVMPNHPMARYMGDVKDVEDLKQKLKQQKRLENKTMLELKKDYKRERIEIPALEDLKQIEEIKIETSHKLIADIPMTENSPMIFEHKYQRYEWLLQQPDLSDEDKIWIKNYEKTSEYKEIYA